MKKYPWYEKMLCKKIICLIMLCAPSLYASDSTVVTNNNINEHQKNILSKNNISDTENKDINQIFDKLQINMHDMLKTLYPTNASKYFKNPAFISKWDELSLRVDFKINNEFCRALSEKNVESLASLVLDRSEGNTNVSYDVLKESIKSMVDNFKNDQDLNILISYLSLTGGQPYYVPAQSMREWLKTKGVWEDVANIAEDLLKDENENKATQAYELRASMLFSDNSRSKIDIPSKEKLGMVLALENILPQLQQLISLKKQFDIDHPATAQVQTPVIAQQPAVQQPKTLARATTNMAQKVPPAAKGAPGIKKHGIIPPKVPVSKSPVPRGPVAKGPVAKVTPGVNQSPIVPGKQPIKGPAVKGPVKTPMKPGVVNKNATIAAPRATTLPRHNPSMKTPGVQHKVTPVLNNASVQPAVPAPVKIVNPHDAQILALLIKIKDIFAGKWTDSDLPVIVIPNTGQNQQQPVLNQNNIGMLNSTDGWQPYVTNLIDTNQKEEKTEEQIAATVGTGEIVGTEQAYDGELQQ